MLDERDQNVGVDCAMENAMRPLSPDGIPFSSFFHVARRRSSW